MATARGRIAAAAGLLTLSGLLGAAVAVPAPQWEVNNAMTHEGTPGPWHEGQLAMQYEGTPAPQHDIRLTSFHEGTPDPYQD
jgi:hypothetical protein